MAARSDWERGGGAGGGIAAAARPARPRGGGMPLRRGVSCGAERMQNGTQNGVQVLRCVASVDFLAQQRHSIGRTCRADGV